MPRYRRYYRKRPIAYSASRGLVYNTGRKRTRISAARFRSVYRPRYKRYASGSSIHSKMVRFMKTRNATTRNVLPSPGQRENVYQAPEYRSTFTILAGQRTSSVMQFGFADLQAQQIGEIIKYARVKPMTCSVEFTISPQSSQVEIAKQLRVYSIPLYDYPWVSTNINFRQCFANSQANVDMTYQFEMLMSDPLLKEHPLNFDKLNSISRSQKCKVFKPFYMGTDTGANQPPGQPQRDHYWLNAEDCPILSTRTGLPTADSTDNYLPFSGFNSIYGPAQTPFIAFRFTPMMFVYDNAGPTDIVIDFNYRRRYMVKQWLYNPYIQYSSPYFPEEKKGDPDVDPFFSVVSKAPVMANLNIRAEPQSAPVRFKRLRGGPTGPPDPVRRREPDDEDI